MTYSLINVINDHGKTVDGIWMQDHTGTLETADARARATEAANGNRIIVAVVERLNKTFPDYELIANIQRLC